MCSVADLIRLQLNRRLMDDELGTEIEQRHENWMKNSGYLYDRLVVHKTKWPSLTFQWLPTCEPTKDQLVYEFMIGTHTSGKKPQEFIYIMKLSLPYLRDIEEKVGQTPPARIDRVEEFRHEIEVNRARYCPLDPSLVAARVDGGPIAIFRRGNPYPDLLPGCNLEEGFGLEWSPFGLLAADHQGQIAYWDKLDLPHQYFKHDKEIEDCKFVDQSTFLTIGGLGFMDTWDLRTGGIASTLRVSQQDSYALSVNPENPHLILTAGQDTIIRLWDTRNVSCRLYQFDQHTEPVLNLQWSPNSPTIFASGARDSKVKIWDLLRVGFEIPKDQSGTDELLFTHEGHMAEISDLGWNSHCMLLGSTEEYYNSTQMYQISACIQQIEYAEDMEYLRDQCLS